MKPVRRVRVVDTVTERLLTAVARGEFARDEKLPSERELASMLQVSRNVLRESIRQLESMGLITVRQGDGTYVNDTTATSLAKKAASFLVFDDTDLSDLVEARQAIEVKAVILAAARSTKDDMAVMRRIVDEMNELISSPAKYVDKDLEFHRAIMKSSRNKVLMRLFETVQDVLTVQLRRLTEIQGVTEQSHRYHQRILEAISIRDSMAAGRLMDEHIANITHRFLEEIARRSMEDST